MFSNISNVDRLGDKQKEEDLLVSTQYTLQASLNANTRDLEEYYAFKVKKLRGESERLI